LIEFLCYEALYSIRRVKRKNKRRKVRTSNVVISSGIKNVLSWAVPKAIGGSGNIQMKPPP